MKNKLTILKIIIVILCIIFIYYNTYTQLSYFFIDASNTKRVIAFGMAKTTDPLIIYRISKIIFLDILTIFIFYASFKTINEI